MWIDMSARPMLFNNLQIEQLRFQAKIQLFYKVLKRRSIK